MFGKSAKQTVIVTNPAGLHARPCSAIVKAANSFKSEIEISKKNETVDARNILELMTLCAMQGTELTVTAKGPDAEEALEAVIAELSKKYD